MASRADSWTRPSGSQRMLDAMVCAALLVLPAAGQGGRTLKAGYGVSPPVTYVDAQGKAAGFAVDVLNEAARREGLRLEWVRPEGITANDALDRGTLDLLAAGIPTPERRERFYVSEPWWEVDLLAVALVAGPVRREADLKGIRIATPGSAVRLASSYGPSAVVPVSSATAAATEVCAGRADAAIIATMFLRELLFEPPEACRGVRLRTVDLAKKADLALVARREVMGEAARLRRAIDRITLEGGLIRIAARHEPMSMPNAERATRLLQSEYERNLSRLTLGGVGAILLLAAAFLVWLQTSRRQLRNANALLSESAALREGAMRALSRSEERFRRLVNSGFDWIWEIDAEGRYTFAGPQVKQLLGYEPEEVVGRYFEEFMSPTEAKRVRAIFERHRAEREQAATVEMVNLHKDGREVVLESSGVMLTGPEGEFMGYCGADRDITARRRAEFLRAVQAKTTRALASGGKLAERMEGVLSALAKLGPYRFGTSWHLEEFSDVLRCSGIWAAPDFEAEPLRQAVGETAPRRAECIAAEALETGQPQCLALAGKGSELALEAAARAAGLDWALVVPLRCANQTTGVLILLADEECHLEPTLVEVLQRVSGQAGEFLERERAQESVRRFVAASPAVLYALRVTKGGFMPTFVSDNLERLTGHPAQGALANDWWMNGLHPEDRERVLAESAGILKAGQQTLEFRFRCADGRYLWISDEKRLIRDENGEPQEVVGSWSDITRRMELERRFQQTQKLEALGVLAAGIAHDFNNLLTVVTGYAQILHARLESDAVARGYVDQVLKSSERAARLTRQLLTFSRRQEVQHQRVILPAIVAEMEKMIRRLIGEDVEVVVEAGGGNPILADPGQIEQVLMNLVVNARDAMPGGGRLTVVTQDVQLDEERPGVPAGLYSVLTVSDTGVGMEEPVLRQAFTPFFTTKGVGVGTGLGLSTVYGIVTQSGGAIEVESRPGIGTTFRVWFPVSRAEKEAECEAPAEEEWVGTETILLVEDEDLVREVAGAALRSRGYKVIEASGPEEALALVAAGSEMHLLLTDVVMPRMGGVELAEQIVELRPGIRVLFMTGYADRELNGRGLPKGDAGCVAKPFTLDTLARKVRHALDSPGV